MVSNEALRDAIEVCHVTFHWSVIDMSRHGSVAWIPSPCVLFELLTPLTTARSVLSDAHHQLIVDQVINWTKGKMLGRGAFGTVWVALNTDTGQFLAAKQVTLGQGRAADEKSIAIMRNEVQ